MALLFLFGCTDVVLLVCAVAVGLNSAITQLFFLFLKLDDKVAIYNSGEKNGYFFYHYNYILPAKLEFLFKETNLPVLFFYFFSY